MSLCECRTESTQVNMIVLLEMRVRFNFRTFAISYMYQLGAQPALCCTHNSLIRTRVWLFIFEHIKKQVHNTHIFTVLAFRLRLFLDSMLFDKEKKKEMEFSPEEPEKALPIPHSLIKFFFVLLAFYQILWFCMQGKIHCLVLAISCSRRRFPRCTMSL